jgi:YggT family protein
MVIKSILIVLERTLVILILLKVVLSYFMDPLHPIRQSIDRIVDPLLDPIRQIVPVVGGLDFSPLVLLLLVEVFFRILLNIV